MADLDDRGYWPNGALSYPTREEVEASRIEALALREQASAAWNRHVNLSGDRESGLENHPRACPVGCGCVFPAWADRAKWEHMDTAHSDTYDPTIKGGYDLDWPRLEAAPAARGSET